MSDEVEKYAKRVQKALDADEPEDAQYLREQFMEELLEATREAYRVALEGVWGEDLTESELGTLKRSIWIDTGNWTRSGAPAVLITTEHGLIPLLEYPDGWPVQEAATEQLEDHFSKHVYIEGLRSGIDYVAVEEPLLAPAFTRNPTYRPFRARFDRLYERMAEQLADRDCAGFAETFARATRLIEGHEQRLSRDELERALSFMSQRHRTFQRVCQGAGGGRVLHNIAPNAARGAMQRATFGRGVDDDGGKGADRYRTFHDRDPRRVVELRHPFPTEVGVAGDALSVLYRTDKWHDDGDDTDYKHVFEEGVQVFEPIDAQSWLEPAELPREPEGPLALLGQCIGLFVRRVDDDDIYEVHLPRSRDTWLLSAPDGHMLYLYDPSQGFRAIIAGGKLSVEEEGIDH